MPEDPALFTHSTLIDDNNDNNDKLLPSIITIVTIITIITIMTYVAVNISSTSYNRFRSPILEPGTEANIT